MSCHNCSHNHLQHSHSPHEHSLNNKSRYLKIFSKEIFSAAMLIAGIILSHSNILPQGFPQLIFYIAAVIPVAFPVIKDAISLWRKWDFMNEFSLMLLASAGAFYIGEYPEGVAVLLFYCFGEKLEHNISDNVRNRVSSLISKLPNKATVIKDGSRYDAKPEEVPVGSTIAVLPGERIPLDGVLTNRSLDFDTSAITGEAVPKTFAKGDSLKSGMIPIDSEAIITTSAVFSDSSLTKIMKMIEDAANSKSPTENILRRITRWYTPLVVSLALLLILIPWIISLIHPAFNYDFNSWLQRALVFLVCSCPCALVVSVPLSYFMAIGRASSFGVLMKGSKYIDLLLKAKTILLDKTGTITTGEFHISGIMPAENHSVSEVMTVAHSLDAKSSHPLAKAINEYASLNNISPIPGIDVMTIPHGLSANSEEGLLLAGSRSMMRRKGVILPPPQLDDTEICIAVESTYIGSIFLSDTIKTNVKKGIEELHDLGVSNVHILSGDKTEPVAKVAAEIKADNFNANLLPDEKQKIVYDERNQSSGTVLFVGDGINDAPALAAADIGIAMGTNGSSLAMQSADVVIIGDDLYKIPQTMRLAHRVRNTVFQNVIFALAVKALVMTLGAFGIASLWAAVFADTGVTVITILWTIFQLKPQPR